MKASKKRTDKPKELSESAANALEAQKSRKRKVVNTPRGDYKRVNIKPSKTDKINTDEVTPEISLLAQARQFIVDITESEYKIEELTYDHKQGILWFLHKYLPYLNSAVDLKTKFMNTSMTFNLPEGLRLGAFQKQTILDFNEELIKGADSAIYNLFMYYNLFGTSYLFGTDNWEQETHAKLDKAKVEDNGPLSLIRRKLESKPGLKLSHLFRWFEANPGKAEAFFKDTLDPSSDPKYKKLEEKFNIDPETLTLEELEYMQTKAFPLLDNLRFFEKVKALNPAMMSLNLRENNDTGNLLVGIPKSKLLYEEPEFLKAVEDIENFQTEYREFVVTEEGEQDVPLTNEYIDALKKAEEKVEASVDMLEYKGYSRAWVEAHLYPGSEDTDTDITVSNNPYEPLHVFRIKDESLLEDLSNADTLIESAIDLLNVENRQRSHINDTMEKLITLDISASAENNIPAEVLDEIVSDIANAVMTGESNIISLPEGVTLSDQTDIIRATNDTAELERQSKTNIALFFSLSTSMLEDSEAQFSNIYLKIDTAQNVFTKEREAISRMMEEKILKPAAVKAGLFCKNNRGKTVIAYPRISFTKISIGRHSEDYSATSSLVSDRMLPKSKIYSYHNTSEEEVAAELLNDSISITNPEILDALTEKLKGLIDTDKTGKLMSALLSGDNLTVLKILKNTVEPEEGDEETKTEEAEPAMTTLPANEEVAERKPNA